MPPTTTAPAQRPAHGRPPGAEAPGAQTTRAAVLDEVLTLLQARHCSPESAQVVRDLYHHRICGQCGGSGRVHTATASADVILRCGACDRRGIVARYAPLRPTQVELLRLLAAHDHGNGVFMDYRAGRFKHPAAGHQFNRSSLQSLAAQGQLAWGGEPGHVLITPDGRDWIAAHDDAAAHAH